MHPLSLSLFLLLFIVHRHCVAFPQIQVAQNVTELFGPRNDAPCKTKRLLGLKQYKWDEPELGCKPGEGVVVYLLDSGVYTTHDQFSNTNIKSFVIAGVDNTEEDSSGIGHGTGMASLIVGKDLGLVPAAELISGKVHDQQTKMTDLMTNLAAAMDFVFEDFQQRDPSTRFGVITVSLPLLNGDGSQGSLWIEKMVKAKNLGLVLVLAPGNSAENLCYNDQEFPRPTNSNPPKTYEIVVGATDEFNEVASYSNLGSCIDLWAPGSRVHVADDDKNGYAVTSGTSNSAALVAGMIAYTKSCYKGLTQTPSRDFFVQHMTRNRLSVREPLGSIRQNAKPWLAKLSFPLESNIAVYPLGQVPLQNPFQMRNVKWNIGAVTSLDPFYISAQFQDKWEFNPDLLDANTDGKNVMVYLIDSGMNPNNQDFNGAKVLVGDTISGIEGTRMASLIVGAHAGVALKSSLFPIKICGSRGDCAGMEVRNDFMSRIYKGMRIAINHFKTLKDKNGVISINFPLFYEEGNTAWKSWVKEAGKLGLPVVIPAGDNGENRCWVDTKQPIPGKTQPEKTFEFVVGASNERDEDTTFSNRGKCVDVWAPGSHIVAMDSSGKFSSRDGTDQSSAIVTGILSGILSKPKYKGSVDLSLVGAELVSKQIKVDACETCLRGAQPFLAKHAGNLLYE
ncbi:peptidase S8/S53 domain-containing protein [Flagelloscypha sp. PMI_526]|nr:peptidase S8/S53 domain-containing protein [Flagelloscypha sp. PMI_526]